MHARTDAYARRTRARANATQRKREGRREEGTRTGGDVSTLAFSARDSVSCMAARRCVVFTSLNLRRRERKRETAVGKAA
jgi:hypothetical protein